MKKNRPGIKLSVISSKEHIGDLADIIFKETSTLGLRFHETQRFKLEIKKQQVKTKYGMVTVKIGMHHDQIITVSPEYEDCRNIADAQKLPLKDVYELAKKKIKFKKEKKE
jgi:uncharacterized protein (DUF111 family)